jgi:hypothetical protein
MKKKIAKGKIPHAKDEERHAMRISMPAHEYITQLAMAAKKDRIIILDEIINRDKVRNAD